MNAYERTLQQDATNLHRSVSEGECNVPRSLKTSISQTFISAHCISLFYCCLIYGSRWAQALSREESRRHHRRRRRHRRRHLHLVASPRGPDKL